MEQLSIFARNLTTDKTVCDKLISLTDGYQDGKTTYNNGTPWEGPNSNDFTHSLLHAVGLAVPWYWNDLNMIAPGWSNISVPFK